MRYEKKEETTDVAGRAVESASSAGSGAGDNASQAGCAGKASEEAAAGRGEEGGGGGREHKRASHASMAGPQGSGPPLMENHAASSVGGWAADGAE